MGGWYERQGEQIVLQHALFSLSLSLYVCVCVCVCACECVLVSVVCGRVVWRGEGCGAVRLGENKDLYFFLEAISHSKVQSSLRRRQSLKSVGLAQKVAITRKCRSQSLESTTFQISGTSVLFFK